MLEMNLLSPGSQVLLFIHDATGLDILPTHNSDCSQGNICTPISNVQGVGYYPLDKYGCIFDDVKLALILSAKF